MDAATPDTPGNPELCLNLWAYADTRGYIVRIAGRAYALEGDEPAKREILRTLAATDFLQAQWLGVSSQFALYSPSGERLSGIAHTSMLSGESTASILFEPVIRMLGQERPAQLRLTHGTYEEFSLPLPEHPLTLTTIVMEQADGQLIPVFP